MYAVITNECGLPAKVIVVTESEWMAVQRAKQWIHDNNTSTETSLMGGRCELTNRDDSLWGYITIASFPLNG